jgi:hypothetical protein
MATAAKFVLPIPTFLAYLIPLDVDVTGKASPRNRADKSVWKNKNKNNINSEKETWNNYTSPDSSRGDVIIIIIIIIRNGAKTISSQTLFGNLIIVKKKRRIALHQPTAVGVM